MKTYYLLRLENNANTVLRECEAKDLAEAVKFFNSTFRLFNGTGQVPFGLNDNGYRKTGEITYCVAERHDWCRCV